MTVLGLRMSMGLHRGWHRLTNEDYVGCYYPAAYDVLAERGVLFALADGVSTLENGAEASEYVIRHLLEQYYTQPPMRTIAAALEAAMKQVNADFRKYYPDSGSTLVAAVVHQQQVIVGHVGDSRAYWRNAHDVKCLTRDHVLRVQRPDGRWVGKLTRSIGQAEHLNVEITTQNLRSGDRVVLLSDGITRYLDDLAIMRMTEGTIEESLCALVGASLEGGGTDNIGALIVDVGNPLADQNELEQHREKLRKDGAFAIVPDMTLEECEETYRHTVPTRAEISAALHPLASRNWPVILLLMNGVLGLIFTVMAASMILLGGTRVESPVLIPEDVPANILLDEDIEGRYLQFSTAATTHEMMNADVQAFTIEPGTRYLVDSLETDENGIVWLGLLEPGSNRYGWIQRDELPDFEPLD